MEIIYKLVDLLLGGIIERRRKRKKIKDEFEALRLEVLTTTVINNYPVVLHKLRRFFINNGLVANPAFEAFFYEWLANPLVESGREALAPGMYGNAHLSRLERELRELQL